MPQTATDSVDVVIVGGGPSGLMTASELATAGLSVTILEKRGEPALSRAGVLQPRVMEIFEMRGLAAQVLERAQQVNGRRHQARMGIWAGLPEVDYGLLESDYGYVVMLSQLEVERILAERCRDLGVEINRGAEVIGLTHHDDGVAVQYQTADGLAALCGAYIVGADGSRSVVRESAGIDWVGHEARNLAVNVDAELPFPFDEPVTVVNNERGWGLAYPLSESVCRLAVIDAQTMLEVNRDTVIGRDEAFDALLRVFGDDYGRPEARVSQFHDALFRADRMQSGRILLVGESVRVHYPASGVGMNFCLQDAFNLGWKLAATLQGWGPEDLIASYEAERGPEVDTLLDSVRAQTGLQFSFTPESVALKRYLIDDVLPLPAVQKKIAEQLSGINARYGEDPMVGTRMPNLALKGGAGLHADRDVAEYVLVAGPGANPDELHRFDDAAHLRCQVASEEVPGADNVCVLIRPDGYVAATGSIGEISDLATKWNLW